jgi:hypothetical protein
MTAEDDLVLEVQVDRLLEVCDPSKVTAWGWVITPEEVVLAVKEDRLRSNPWNPTKPMMKERQYHIERVAYFVVHGWSDPIDIDVGVPSLGLNIGWVIQDGNHRFYAAVVQGYQSILATISGDLNYAQDLLGVDLDRL